MGANLQRRWFVHPPIGCCREEVVVGSSGAQRRTFVFVCGGSGVYCLAADPSCLPMCIIRNALVAMHLRLFAVFILGGSASIDSNALVKRGGSGNFGYGVAGGKEPVIGVSRLWVQRGSCVSAPPPR